MAQSKHYDDSKRVNITGCTAEPKITFIIRITNEYDTTITLKRGACKTSQVLFAGVPDDYSRCYSVFAHLLIGHSQSKT